MRVGWDDAPKGAVWAGVDTRCAATHWPSVVDGRGSELFTGEFPTGVDGYRSLIGRGRSLGTLIESPLISLTGEVHCIQSLIIVMGSARLAFPGQRAIIHVVGTVRWLVFSQVEVDTWGSCL